MLGHAEWTSTVPRGYSMSMALRVPRYTVDDLEHFPEDGNRCELLDGVLLVTPAPSVAEVFSGLS